MKQLEEQVQTLDTRTEKQGVALAGIQQDCENLKSQMHSFQGDVNVQLSGVSGQLEQMILKICKFLIIYALILT
jgi:hypothetical protein